MLYLQFQDEIEGSLSSHSFHSQDIAQEMSANEDETSFISSPRDKIKSKKPPRRRVKGSPADSMLERNSPDSIHMSKKDKSPSPGSSITKKSKGGSTKKIPVQVRIIFWIKFLYIEFNRN